MVSTLIDLVLDGRKPGAFITKEELESIVELDNSLSLVFNKKYKIFAVSIEGVKVSEVLDENVLSTFNNFNIKEINKKIQKSYDKIKNLEVSDALINISPTYSLKETTEGIFENIILEGLLLGYKPCCVEYYANTRYLGHTKHKFEDDKIYSKDEFLTEEEKPKFKILREVFLKNVNAHIRCYPCSQSILDKRLLKTSYVTFDIL